MADTSNAPLPAVKNKALQRAVVDVLTERFMVGHFEESLPRMRTEKHFEGALASFTGMYEQQAKAVFKAMARAEVWPATDTDTSPAPDAAPDASRAAIEAIAEWLMLDHFGESLPRMRKDENYKKALASYEEMYAEKASEIVTDLAFAGILPAAV